MARYWNLVVAFRRVGVSALVIGPKIAQAVSAGRRYYTILSTPNTYGDAVYYLLIVAHQIEVDAIADQQIVSGVAAPLEKLELVEATARQSKMERKDHDLIVFITTTIREASDHDRGLSDR